MDPPTVPLPLTPKHGDVRTYIATTAPKTPASTKGRSYISCRASTGIPRSSAITFSTESITVFADVNDLPSRNAGQKTLPRKDTWPESDAKGSRFSREYDKHRTKNTGSICSFGFDSAVPEPLQALVGSPTPKPVKEVVPDQNKSRNLSIQSFSQSNNATTNMQSVNKSFPRPPSKAMLHFAKVFPEQARGHKRNLSVNKSLPPPPHHVFDAKKKKRILWMVAIIGILSPVSSFIYFPAIGPISREFHLSYELVLLSITIHMAVQGIAPLFWLPLGDYFGRRPTLLAAFAVFVGANAGLLFSRSFLSLMLLRALQAFGSAYVTSLGAAIIGDISTGTEKGTLLGTFGSILLLGYAISPVIGGVFTYLFGFRSIFWFQLALGGLALNLVVLFLPETLRSMAGNGTIRLKPFQQPLLAVIKRSPDASFDPNPATVTLKPTLKSFVEPFWCLSKVSVLASVIFGSIVFATSVTVIATTALLLESHYHLSTILVGVAFLPSGAGSIIGFSLASYLLDRDFRITEDYYRSHPSTKDNLLPVKDNKGFPIERARHRNIWWITLLFIGATIGYGFSLSAKQIAIPLVLQFFTAFGATAILLLNGVLVTDLCHENCASATVVVNLVRFCMGALAVGVVQLLFNRIGAGFTFLSFAVLLLVFTPVLVLQWIFGVK